MPGIVVREEKREENSPIQIGASCEVEVGIFRLFG
jgi:hypothetical protein